MVAPGTRIGPYEVVREIGRGAMATVFFAVGPAGEGVAIKVLLPALASRARTVERFEREGKILARLRVEQIAKVIEVGRLPDGTPYHVIELLHGLDLKMLVDQRGPLPIREATEYVAQACLGVAAAHDAGILHRDLKLANIFVCRGADDRVTVKVLDFGVAKDLFEEEASLTGTSDLIGSPHYIAPEQFGDSRKVTPQTDVWSLGVVLYRLLVVQAPFEGESLPQLCMSILHEPPRPIRTLRGDIPEALAAVITRTLEKVPADRYPSALAFAEALAPFRASTLAIDEGPGEGPNSSRTIVSAPPSDALRAAHRPNSSLESRLKLPQLADEESGGGGGGTVRMATTNENETVVERTLPLRRVSAPPLSPQAIPPMPLVRPSVEPIPPSAPTGPTAVAQAASETTTRTANHSSGRGVAILVTAILFAACLAVALYSFRR